MKRDSLHKLIEKTFDIEFFYTGCDRIRAELEIQKILERNARKTAGLGDLILANSPAQSIIKMNKQISINIEKLELTY